MSAALSHLRGSDSRLAALIDRIGPYSIAYRPPEFATLARSVVYQQLSGKAAATIFGRLEQAVHPDPVTASSLSGLTVEELRALGLSQQKTSYLHALAEMTLSSKIDFALLPALPDEDVIAHLTAVKGIGAWTAQMFLIFALRRPDVLPTGDLGVRNAMQRLYRLKTPPVPSRMERIARPWRPFSSVACWYLWRSLDNVAAL